jgi:hypothetical protein
MIRMFIPDPGSQIWIFSIPDPRVKKAPDPGSESATLGNVLRTRTKLQITCKAPVPMLNLFNKEHVSNFTWSQFYNTIYPKNFQTQVSLSNLCRGGYFLLHNRE